MLAFGRQAARRLVFKANPAGLRLCPTCCLLLTLPRNTTETPFSSDRDTPVDRHVPAIVILSILTAIILFGILAFRFGLFGPLRHRHRETPTAAAAPIGLLPRMQQPALSVAQAQGLQAPECAPAPSSQDPETLPQRPAVPIYTFPRRDVDLDKDGNKNHEMDNWQTILEARDLWHSHLVDPGVDESLRGHFMAHEVLEGPFSRITSIMVEAQLAAHHRIYGTADSGVSTLYGFPHPPDTAFGFVAFSHDNISDDAIAHPDSPNILPIEL
ncbi:uncharacterized protein ARMOST_07631 [Armillaria ostoyae]|uniref:Uncharacterized protein n=1 Tax=Armillaria ostoyae TaxID=47428 RepID=A0A284R6E6_ARMOS|nr:uncharacterized protein ARMOST_07631 [Armillaria ostoyae]